jgi:hypothetical protein
VAQKGKKRHGCHHCNTVASPRCLFFFFSSCSTSALASILLFPSRVCLSVCVCLEVRCPTQRNPPRSLRLALSSYTPRHLNDQLPFPCGCAFFFSSSREGGKGWGTCEALHFGGLPILYTFPLFLQAQSFFFFSAVAVNVDGRLRAGQMSLAGGTAPTVTKRETTTREVVTEK